jgi:hypothetical protein
MGDSEKIAVPEVVGSTQDQAETLLKNAGDFVVGVTRENSNSTPRGCVISVVPDSGTRVDRGSRVTLQVSTGPSFSPSVARPSTLVRLTDTIQFITPVLGNLLGLIVLAVIAYAMLNPKSQFLQIIAEQRVARGLITFLIAITTVGIAIILALSSVSGEATDADDKRFDRGKQVLTMLIGVLRTIVGFYFGSAAPQQTSTASPQPTIITTTLRRCQMALPMQSIHQRF